MRLWHNEVTELVHNKLRQRPLESMETRAHFLPPHPPQKNQREDLDEHSWVRHLILWGIGIDPGPRSGTGQYEVRRKNEAQMKG